MSSQTYLSRRQLLEAAGGVTFLALVPRVGHSEAKGVTFELPSAGQGRKRPPVFTALPYIQPGPSSKLVDGGESIVVAWQTDNFPAEFEVRFGERTLSEPAQIEVRHRDGPHEDTEKRINYSAILNGLKLQTKYHYRVSMDGTTFLEGFFTTRKPRGSKTRFVAFGDNSFGDISDRAVAFQAYRALPDFVLNAGDNVYDNGLDNEYARYFFPVYNADQAAARTGAPLLRSVPFYTVLANHDVHDKDVHGAPVADFTKNPDSLAYYTNMYLPLNGPTPSQPPSIIGDEAAFAVFREAAADRFPRMANYSFDYGDGHFLCLDSNLYIDPTDEKLLAWIEEDLGGADARWKFVTFHHPPFNVGNQHYEEQHMRALSPVFEKHGVSIVFSGHEHTYQRTRPLKFKPSSLALAMKAKAKKRLVPGEFSIDRNYDGVHSTRMDGVMYVTTGAGGKHLYDPEMNESPQNWLHEEDGNADYVVRLVSDRHSITLIDMETHRLTIRQVDEWGGEIDHFLITV